MSLVLLAMVSLVPPVSLHAQGASDEPTRLTVITARDEDSCRDVFDVFPRLEPLRLIRDLAATAGRSRLSSDSGYVFLPLDFLVGNQRDFLNEFICIKKDQLFYRTATIESVLGNASVYYEYSITNQSPGGSDKTDLQTRAVTQTIPANCEAAGRHDFHRCLYVLRSEAVRWSDAGQTTSWFAGDFYSDDGSYAWEQWVAEIGKVVEASPIDVRFPIPILTMGCSTPSRCPLDFLWERSDPIMPITPITLFLWRVQEAVREQQ